MGEQCESQSTNDETSNRRSMHFYKRTNSDLARKIAPAKTAIFKTHLPIKLRCSGFAKNTKVSGIS